MNCAQVQEQMAAYVGNRVSVAVSETIERHLAICADCELWREEVAELAAIWQHEDEVVPELNLVTGVLAQLESRPQRETAIKVLPKMPRRRLIRQSALHYGLAASMTVALFGLGVFDHLGTGLAHNSVVLSNQVQSLLRLISNVHF